MFKKRDLRLGCRFAILSEDFSMQMVLKAGQILSSIQKLHSCGFMVGNLKPDYSFCFVIYANLHD